MSRWRDTKKGKDTSKDNTTLSIEEVDTINATLLSRAKAFVTDSFMIVMPLMYLSIYLIMGGRELFEQNMLLGWLFILVPYLIITVLFIVIKGQTPGLKAYEIKIVDNRTHENISIFTATLRFLLFVLSIISIIGVLIPLFRKDSKTIQDLLASTAVINYPNEK
ncbi:MAG: RDD family protein [Campylobacteraceae bacterium]|nr:RDD family protein [Campylobacteraceae bacterium]